MPRSEDGSRATRRAIAATVSGLASSLLVAMGIGVSGCQPQGRSSASSGSAATPTVIASQGSPTVAPAPDPSVYDTKLVPPRMGQNPSNNHVFVLEGTLPARGRVTKPFNLPKLATISVLLVGDGVRCSFRSPYGETIVPGETKGRPGLQYVDGAEGAGFTLDAPEQGAWSVVLESKSDRSMSYAVDIRSEGIAGEVAHLETMLQDSDPSLSFLARPGDPVFVRTLVTAAGRPVTGTTWDIQARSPKGTAISIPVYDDGRHADGAANDGISVGALVAEGPDGFYELRATAQSPSGVEYVVTGTIEVQAQNDLLIAGEIEVSPREPKVGEPVTLTVTVLNAGTGDSGDVELEFFVGARKQSSQRFGLQAGESKRIATTWTPGAANNYDVQLTINPDTEPYASNFENNTKRTSVAVR